MKKTGISILCFLLVSLSLSNLFAETDGDSEIQITNQSKILQVVKASKSQKDGYTLISFRTKLRDYTLMPYGSHIHVELYGKNGELLEHYVQRLRKHQFRHTVTGRHRPSNSNKRVYVSEADIALIKIHAFTESHDKHS